MLEVRYQGVKFKTIAPGSVDTSFCREPGDARVESWMLTAQDVAYAVVAVVRARGGAHQSRIEMRPLQPPKRA